MTDALGKSISLRALELFEALASCESMQKAARSVGLSAPAASQQIRSLEAALGHDLVDHARRPLELTQAGYVYLAHARAALQQLRQGEAALSLMDLTRLRRLRIGIIDDFDSEVTPRLTVALAAVLRNCDLKLHTGLSQAILDQVSSRTIDLGIAAQPFDKPAALTETPLLRDPFLLAVPRGFLPGPPTSLDALTGLSFLRYERSQMIGRQIAAHLGRLRLSPESRIEMDSNQAIFGLVASGAGWTISTALGYLRARNFHGAVDIHPLPFAGFSRTISAFHTLDQHDQIPAVILATLRGIIRVDVIGPGLLAHPWLHGTFGFLSDDTAQTLVE